MHTPIMHQFHHHSLRAIVRDNQIWFIVKDLCSILRCHRSRALTQLDPCHKARVVIDVNGQAIPMVVVNEAGGGRLIANSRGPLRDDFRRWVETALLPTVRGETVNGKAPEAPKPEPAKAKVREALSSAELISFSFEGNSFTAIVDAHGEPWFMAGEVCRVLGIANVGNALSRLDDNEKNSIHLADGNRGSPNRVIINESGLYAIPPQELTCLRKFQAARAA